MNRVYLYRCIDSGEDCGKIVAWGNKRLTMVIISPPICTGRGISTHNVKPITPKQHRPKPETWLSDLCDRLPEVQ